MSKKTETILIRLDSNVKERFRLYCKSKQLTMTDVVLDEINNLLLDSEDSDKLSDSSLMKKERNFFKSELSIYKDAYSNIRNVISSLDEKYVNSLVKTSTNLFIDYFQKIQQFEGYDLEKIRENINGFPNFIAVNKVTNHKLLFDLRVSISRNSFRKEKRNYYLSFLKRHGNKNNVKLVFISINPLNDIIHTDIKELSEEIGYDVVVYHMDDLLNH